MKFQVNKKVIVLDTTNKPAGTADIISCNPDGSSYKIKFQSYNSERVEVIEMPEKRLITNTDFSKAANKG